MTIGEVLAALRPDFADMTISKIRFLDGAGLVSPRRSGSGYRRFSDADVVRLRQVLTLQRDHYLPLKVIRAHIAAGTLDRALSEPAEPEPAGPESAGPERAGPERAGPERAEHERYRPRAPVPTRAPSSVAPAAAIRSAPPRRLRIEDLLRGSGLSIETLTELETAGLLRSRNGWYHPEDLAVAVAAAQLAAHGIGPRHLRTLRNGADRELGLLEQSLVPVLRRARPDARVRAEETAIALRELYGQVHTALVTAGLRDLGVDPS